MFLIGSLFRRLTPANQHRLHIDEARERHMWTRIREHLAATSTKPEDCLYVCGAFHAASHVGNSASPAPTPTRSHPAPTQPGDTA